MRLRWREAAHCLLAGPKWAGADVDGNACSALAHEALNKEEGRCRLPVLDLAAPEQVQRRRPGGFPHLHELILLPGVVSRCEARRNEEMDPLVGESGGGVDGGEPLAAAGLEAGLLPEFPPGAVCGVLA